MQPVTFREAFQAKSVGGAEAERRLIWYDSRVRHDNEVCERDSRGRKACFRLRCKPEGPVTFIGRLGLGTGEAHGLSTKLALDVTTVNVIS